MPNPDKEILLTYSTQRIETTRLLLFKPTTEDFLTLEYLWRNKEVRKFLGGTVSNTIINQRIADIQDHWKLHDFGFLVVYNKASNQIIGLCGLHHSSDGIEISYMFFPEFWGNGFAYEAVTKCMYDGFHVLDIERIIAITQAKNITSCNLLNKIGMRHIKNFMRFNAAQSLYELTKENFRY